MKSICIGGGGGREGGGGGCGAGQAYSPHLTVTNEDAISKGRDGGYVGGQLAVLALPQQLLLAQLVDAQDVATASQQAPLERRQGTWRVPNRRPVH